MKRKGQGAMEYLMTYGWAILVVMIVGVVLWQLGVFGGGPGAVNTARGFGKVKVFEPSIKVADSILTFTFTNGAGQTISDLVVTTNAPCSNSTLWESLGAGSTGNMQCEFSPGVSAGASFSVDVDVAYNVTVAGAKTSHSEQGTIRGSAEPI